MRYSELINEGRDAPLYHATKWYDGVDIVKTNTIEARTSHHISHYLDSVFKIPQSAKKDGVFADEYKIEVVSLTRSFHFAKNWFKNPPPFILILNQAKLSYNYKIVPIDFWTKNYVHDIQLYNNIDDNPEMEQRIMNQWHKVNERRKKPTWSESEEFLLKDLKNLDKYLLGIYTDIEFLKRQPDIDDHTLSKIEYWSNQPIVKRMK